MPQKDSSRLAAAFLLVVVLTLIVYSSVRHCDFVDFDDGVYVTKNEWVQKGLTADGMRKAFTKPVSALVYPLTMLSHMLDCELFGRNPSAHHMVNAAIHALNAGILFLLLKSLTRQFWPSLAAALIFGIHPLNVEAVAWISQRKSVLSMLFGLLTIAVYVRYVRRRSLAGYIAVIMLFAFSLLSKATFVVLPCVLLLLDFWPLNRLVLQKEDGKTGWGRTLFAGENRSLLCEKLPLLALSAASSALTLSTQGSSGAMGTLVSMSLPARFAMTCSSYLFYVVKFVAPFRLSAVYSPSGAPIPAWETALGFLVLLAATDWALRTAETRPCVTVGWFWFAGVLFPVSGLFQTGMVARADRFAYAPMIGLIIMLVWGVQELLRRCGQRVRQVVYVFFPLVLIGLAIASTHQIGTWRDSMSLFSHASALNDNNDVAQCILGEMLGKRGRHAEALQAFKKVIQINPQSAVAHYNAGAVLTHLGNTDEALPFFAKAVELEPDSDLYHYNLGLALQAQGLHQEADTHLKEGLRLANAQGHTDLAKEIQATMYPPGRQ
ncbi:MAG: tetratricopeptide repeat protein [Verrucomicrobia bacterium]|nr:tetratricopeptide repeat protein [Verrucomicrobiota bacterium]